MSGRVIIRGIGKAEDGTIFSTPREGHDPAVDDTTMLVCPYNTDQYCWENCAVYQEQVIVVGTDDVLTAVCGASGALIGAYGKISRKPKLTTPGDVAPFPPGRK